MSEQREREQTPPAAAAPPPPTTTLGAPRVVVTGTARIDYPPESGLPPREFRFTSAPLDPAAFTRDAEPETEPETEPAA